MTYAEKLKDPRWKARRKEIFERDDFACRDCGSERLSLHCHHLLYLSIYENPWEYPDDLLLTLCSTCHKRRHDAEKYVKPIATMLPAEASWIFASVATELARMHAAAPFSGREEMASAVCEMLIFGLHKNLGLISHNGRTRLLSMVKRELSQIKQPVEEP